MASIEGGQLTNYNGRIQYLGASSGLDISALVNVQLQAESLKIDPYYTTLDNYTAEKTVWANFKTQMNKVLSLSKEVQNLTSVNQTSSYSKEGFVEVTAQGDAIAGKYSISVEQLATAHKVMSDAVSSSTTPLGFKGTLNVDGQEIQVETNMSLTDIAKQINKSKAEVDATVVGGHLFLTSQKTGAASAINIENTSDASRIVVSDTSKLGVEIVGDISGLNPQYTVEVQQLATKQKVESNKVLNPDNALNYSGSFTVNGQEIEVRTTDKLSDIVKKINDKEDVGVKASIVNGKLVLESKETGAANAFTVQDTTTSVDRANGLFQHIGLTDGLGDFRNEVQTAQDAAYTIDGVGYASSINTAKEIAGVEFELKTVTTAPIQIDVTTGGVDIATQLGLTLSGGGIKNELQQGQDAMYTVEGISRTSATNTITDVVQDMSFELLKVTNEAIEVKVDSNTDALAQKMKEFVTAYNQTMSFINSYSNEGGALQGESLLKNAKSTLRSLLYENGENGMGMYALGIEGSSTAKDGSITFDETKFKTALKDNYQNVISYLTGANGVAKKFYDKVNEFTKTAGVIDNKTESIDRSIKSLDKTIERKELAYEKLQERLLKQYQQMESALSKMNGQLSYLKSMLGTKDSD